MRLLELRGVQVDQQALAGNRTIDRCAKVLKETSFGSSLCQQLDIYCINRHGFTSIRKAPQMRIVRIALFVLVISGAGIATSISAATKKIGSFSLIESRDEITNETVTLFTTPEIGATNIDLVLSCFHEHVVAGLNFPRAMPGGWRLRWKGGWANMLRGESGRYFMIGGPGGNDVEIIEFLKSAGSQKAIAKAGLSNQYFGDEKVLSFRTAGVETVIAYLRPNCRAE